MGTMVPMSAIYDDEIVENPTVMRHSVGIVKNRSSINNI